MSLEQKDWTIQVNQLAEAWYALSPEKDDARRRKLSEELWMLVYEHLREEERPYLGRAFLAMSGFDPARSPFSSYLSLRLQMARKDAYRENAHGLQKRLSARQRQELTPEEQERVKEESRIRLTSLDGADGDAPDLGALLPDARAADPSAAAEDADAADALILRWTALVLNLHAHLEGKADNPQRRRYFHLFYTADVTNAIKTENLFKELRAHERDVFQAMEAAFLDFYMSAVCRTLVAIRRTRLRPFGELAPGEGPGETPLPLQAIVYCAYLERGEGKRVTRRNIDLQHTAYRELVREKLVKREPAPEKGAPC